LPAARLIALLDHLGIAKAHIATQIPADIRPREGTGGTPRRDRAGRAGTARSGAAAAEQALMVSGEYGPIFAVCLQLADARGEK
jgi:hypothetical protein